MPCRYTYVDGLTGGTYIKLRREAIERYPINYVAGFHSGGFAYFLTTQPESFLMGEAGTTQPLVSERHASRLVQICTGDRRFYSYVEFSIRCRTNATDYGLVQSATVLDSGWIVGIFVCFSFF